MNLKKNVVVSSDQDGKWTAINRCLTKGGAERAAAKLERTQPGQKHTVVQGGKKGKR